MRSPAKVIREKYQSAKEIYEENPTYYAFCAGSIFTSATIFAATKFAQSKGYGMPKIPDYYDIKANLTAAEMAKVLAEQKAFDLTNPVTGFTIGVVASDFIE